MSTHSMIGLDEHPDGPGRFVFCHYEGFPTGVGNALRAIIDRDGPERAVATILAHSCWRYLDPDKGAEEDRHDGGDPVPGYGVACRHDLVLKPRTLAEAVGPSDVWFVYAIDLAGGITVYDLKRHYDGIWSWDLRPGKYFESNERPERSYRNVFTNRGRASGRKRKKP